MAEELKRRPVLKGLGVAAAVAAVLPKSWTKPMVQSIAVPAHAAASPAIAAPLATTQAPTTADQVLVGGITNSGVVSLSEP